MERIQTWEAFSTGPSDPAAELPVHEYGALMAYVRGKAERQKEEARKAKGKGGGKGRYPRRGR